jgi:hypothetical protein
MLSFSLLVYGWGKAGRIIFGFLLTKGLVGESEGVAGSSGFWGAGERFYAAEEVHHIDGS